VKNILVIYAHPSPKRSGLNQHLFAAAGALTHVETRDLYELYPNLHIDVRAEQDALRQADAVIFQFPIYWFSSPAILKEWQDTVLTSSFAYGGKENALDGKLFMLAVSTGGAPSSYSQRGRHGAGIANYLAPFEQTARFCGMKLLDSIIVQNVGSLTPSDLEHAEQTYLARLNKIGECTDGT